MNLAKIFSNGLIRENPVFKLLLGMCPALAVTTSAMNGLGMGLATTAVLLGSNIVIALIKNLIPSEIRIPAYIVVIATFVTMIGMLMQAFVPALYDSLGIFIPLIVVNCIVLGRAESFASKNGLVSSAADGLGMGLGFTLALVILASVREILGAGTIFGFGLFPEAFEPVGIMIMPPGAFLSLGFIVAVINKLSAKTQ